MKQILLLASVIVMGYTQINAQCYPDRHNLSLANAWLSCETSMSPNLARGEGHWIMYDLGTAYELGSTTFWNINNYLRQDDGMQDVSIDVSLNGSTWTEAARFTLAQGPVSGIYEGVDGPDLTGTTARFVLISGLSNYGGSCMGLSEFKVQATPATTTSVSRLELGASIAASPNPFQSRTTIDIELSLDGQYRYSLIGVDGRLAADGQVVISGGLGQVDLDASTLEAGVYIFSVASDQTQSSITIIKQ